MTAENELGVTSMKSEKSGLEAVAIVQVSLNVPGRRDDAPIGSSFLLYFKRELLASSEVRGQLQLNENLSLLNAGKNCRHHLCLPPTPQLPSL